MQNLGDIVGWVDMDSSQSLFFKGARAREVVIHVNTPYPTLFAIEPAVEGEDEPVQFFLARVEGFDTLRFNVPAGNFDLLRIDGGTHTAYMRTADGSEQHRENIGLEKFTEIHERRQLSPEYQFVLDQVQKNAMRNMQMMGSEIEQLRRQVADTQRVAASAPAPVPVAQEPANVPAAPPVSAVGAGSEGQGGSEGGQ